MGERLQSQKSYICSFFDCKAKFSKSWKLEAHLCKHTGLKPFACENCDKSFCTRYQLTRHDLSHSGEKPHKCVADGCSEAFVTNASMKNHLARVHQHREKRYKCDHKGCRKDFKKRYQLKAHTCEHQQTLPFHCSVSGCARGFPSRGTLKHHVKMHAGYPCEEELCPFLGKTWSELQKHKKEHRVKLPCGSCHKRFNNAWFLRQHQLHVHSGPKKSFKCTRGGCSKSFTKRFNLESHLLGEHQGKKAFSCSQPSCGKSFAMKESLWRHGVAHDPEKKKIKKLRPRKNQPWRVALRATLTAAANQAETHKLAAKLRKTHLGDPKS